MKGLMGVAIRKGSLALGLAGIVVESSCGVVEEHIECPEKTPVDNICIAIYDPVCGEDELTYINSCESCKYTLSYFIGECE